MASNAMFFGLTAMGREAMRDLEKLESENCISNVRSKMPPLRDEDLARIKEGLKLACLPK
jgi:hypothetical protein